MRELYFIFCNSHRISANPDAIYKCTDVKKEEVPQNISAFPLGKENTGFKQYFTGESWLAPLTGNKDLNVPMSNVTFEPVAEITGTAIRADKSSLLSEVWDIIRNVAKRHAACSR